MKSTPLVITLAIGLLTSIVGCQFQQDQQDQQKAEKQSASYEKSTQESMNKITKLKESFRTAFVTSNYLWVYAPSSLACAFHEEKYQWSFPREKQVSLKGGYFAKVTSEAKAELDSEKKLSDPSLFDGSKDVMLCSRKLVEH